MISSFTGPHRFLSNFYPATVRYYEEDPWYPSVGHAYQAAKTVDPRHRACIASFSQPGAAKRYGRNVPLRPDWEDVKLGIMTALVRQKFTDLLLAQLLLDTGNQELVEGNTWGDTFWGACRGRGQNHLGKILMQIRSEIRDRE